MKKVILCAVFCFLVGTMSFGGPPKTPTITGATPAAKSYVRNSSIKFANINLSGNTGPYAKNFIDILPMHPTTSALDRINWQLSGSSTLVEIPFHIWVAGSTTKEIKAIGTADGTLTSNNVFTKDSSNANFSFSYDFTIDPNANYFANGTYTKTIRLRLWNNVTIATWTSGASSATADITISLTVAGNASSLSLSTSSLSFGELTSTQTPRTFTASITSNQPYTLSMVSANNYSLEYWNPLSGIEKIPGENAPYEVLINDKTYSPTANPDSGKVAIVSTMTSSVTDYPYPGTITLQTVTAATAGDYKDTLTFTVSAP